jgi:putative hydrolase of the HAD superfamily
VAEILGLDGDAFFTALTGSFTERSTGVLGDQRATLAHMARRCGGRPDDGQLAAACAHRTELEWRFASAYRPESLAVLEHLAAASVPVGVVSDCTHELVQIWDRLPVAGVVGVAALSVSLGVKKPDPAMYVHACDGLGVDPAAVLYVGDGGSHELTGARALGMRAVRLAGAEAADALVYDFDHGWDGPVITSLHQVPELAGLGS